MALMSVRNLSVGYDSHLIKENINFSINQGDYLCIVGENGSGKSTLMKTLLHLQKPLAGEILTGDGLQENEIGYLPQQTDVQKDFPASVREIVLSGCQGRRRNRPFYNREDKQMAARNLERMEIAELAGKCYRELSGGQQQRVLLARAICATEKMLFLDEPVAGLDPKVTVALYELIEKLNRDGITIVMVSHDIDAALAYATHILHVGKQTFFGTKDDYLKSEYGKMFLAQEGGADNV